MPEFVKYRRTGKYGDEHGIGRVTRFQNNKVYVIWPEHGSTVYGLNLGHVEFVDRQDVHDYTEFLKVKYGFAAVLMVMTLFDIDPATEEGADAHLSLCEEMAET